MNWKLNVIVKLINHGNFLNIIYFRKYYFSMPSLVLTGCFIPLQLSNPSLIIYIYSGFKSYNPNPKSNDLILVL